MLALAVSLLIVGWLLLWSGFTNNSPINELKHVFNAKR